MRYSAPERGVTLLGYRYWSVPVAAALGFVMGYCPSIRFYVLLAFLALWPIAMLFTSERVSRAIGRALES